MYPDKNSFTCVGVTKQGRRCRNSFISRADLLQAIQILDSIESLNVLSEHFINRVDSKLDQLADLTLCPRWHRVDRYGNSQKHQTATKWLNSVGDYRRRALAREAVREPQTPSYYSLPQRQTPGSTSIVSWVQSVPSSQFTRLRTDAGVDSRSLSPLVAPQHHTSTTSSNSRGSWRSATQIPSSGTALSAFTESSLVVASSNTASSRIRRGPYAYPTSISISSSNDDARSSSLNSNRSSLFLDSDSDSEYASTARNTSSTRSTVPASSAASSSRSSPLASSYSLPSSRVSSRQSMRSSGNNDPPANPLATAIAMNLSDAAAEQLTTSIITALTTNDNSPLGVALRAAVRANGHTMRRPIEDCYVCASPINQASDAVWCRSSCGQSLHTECFEHWRDQQETHELTVKCAYW